MLNTDQQRAWVTTNVERYELALLRYSARMGLDLDLARDCVQHAFLRLCEQDRERLEATRGERGVAAWLYAVVRNRAVDRLRLARREIPFAALDNQTNNDESSDRAPTEPYSAEQEPGEAIAAREVAAMLRGLVAELAPPAREVVLLWADGFSHAEIAHVTARAESTIRVTLHRALTRLREHARVKRWLHEHDAADALTTTRNR